MFVDKPDPVPVQPATPQPAPQQSFLDTMADNPGLVVITTVIVGMVSLAVCAGVTSSIQKSKSKDVPAGNVRKY